MDPGFSVGAAYLIVESHASLFLRLAHSDISCKSDVHLCFLHGVVRPRAAASLIHFHLRKSLTSASRLVCDN